MVALSVLLALQISPGVPARRDTVPEILLRIRPVPRVAVQFRAIASRDTVYVGEQVTYQVAAFFERSVRDRVRRPEFFAPEMRGMLAYEPSSDLPAHDVSAHGDSYEVFIYERPVFALAPGRLTIPPARLTYAMPLSPSFFSRDESYERRSDSISLVVLDPPAEGRHADFGGAVGRFALRARFEGGPARVGDPITLAVAVSGTGNIKLLPRPVLRIPWASVVPADERVVLDTTRTVRGTKEFEWVLTPTRAGVQALAPIEYWYFDPAFRRYDVALSVPETLDVQPGALATVDTATAVAEPLALRTTYRGPLPRPVHEHRAFWLALALVPLPALATLVKRPARRPRAARPAALALRALARSQRRGSARDIRRAFVRAVSDRIGVPNAELATRGALTRLARRAGVTAATAAAAEALLAELDAEAYGVSPPSMSDGGRRAYAIYRQLDREAQPLASRADTTGPVVLSTILVAAFATSVALAALPPAARFAAGVAAYGAKQWDSAAKEFAAIASAEPRAADAWANLGTASWSGDDTARAVVGWQRALRLEPLASDLRGRLSLVDANDHSPLGAVPPLPPAAVMYLAAALWCSAWLALLLRRRRPGTASLALLCGAAAIVASGSALTLEQYLADRRLAVVESSTGIRTSPSLGSELTGGARAGEIVRAKERRGDWTHVEQNGGRDGWVESEYLVPLVRD